MAKKMYISPLFIEEPGDHTEPYGNSEDTHIFNSNGNQSPRLNVTEEQLLEISNNYNPMQVWELDTNEDGVVTTDEVPE